MHQQSQKTAHSTTAGSWVDIPSQHSSSSLSSAADDIIGTDLRVEPHKITRRRNWTASDFNNQPDFLDHQSSTGESSQDEYDESESEPDQLLTSSNEGIQPFRIPQGPKTIDPIDVSNTQQCFTPQPNAFSHPPSATFQSRDFVPGSYFPAPRELQPDDQTQASQPHRQSHFPFTSISTAYQADQDAALRASLNTLLSCAAAARSLPKKTHGQPLSYHQAGSNRIQPSSLRIVPESVVLGNRTTYCEFESSRSSSLYSTVGNSGKYTRKVTPGPSKDGRSIKKLQKPGLEDIPAPTLLTWIVSAGVLVLVSAISFSAGFATGRETGRLNAELALGSESDAIKDLGQETARYGLGFRRLRWTGATNVVRV